MQVGQFSYWNHRHEVLAGGAVDLQREQGEDGPGGAEHQCLLGEQEVRPRPRQRRLPQRHQQRQD